MLTRKRLALAAILLVGLAYATMIQSFSWNQTSHYDLIRSLDKDGTTIDAYQQNTGDKAYYKGHYYSARAPGLALFALQHPLLQAGVLNAEDLTLAAGRMGTLRQELLNVWTWDAAIGLSCVLSVLTVPTGIYLLEVATRRDEPDDSPAKPTLPTSTTPDR